MRWRPSALLRIWLALSLLAPGAPAQDEQNDNPAPLDLTYRAPRECPSAAAFESEVRELVQSPQRIEGPLVLTVEIHREEERKFVATLSLITGERDVEGASCEDVVRAAALFAALLLEDPEYERAARAARARATPPDPSPAAPPPIHSGPRAFVGAHVGLDVGTLARPVLLPALSTGVLFAVFQLRARALVSTPVHTLFDNGRQLRTQIAAGEIMGCWHALRSSRWRAGPCLGASSGVLFADATGVESPTQGRPAFVDSQLGAAIWFLATDHWNVSWNAQWSQPLVIPHVVLEGPGPEILAHRSSPALRTHLGLQFLF